jgi:hypothetical protein
MNFPLFFENFLSKSFFPSPSTIDLCKDMIFDYNESNNNFDMDLNRLYILNH